MKLSEMKELLTERQLQLTKSLGQNFLHDGNQLQRIVDMAELGRSDSVLEIGAGLGPLTQRLVEKAGKVLAIEKDDRLVDLLRHRVSRWPAGEGVLEIVADDALRFLRQNPRDWTGWKLVSNLPYSVASPLMVDLAMMPQPPERLVATLQLEVAQRMMAEADEEEYGILSLLIQAHYQPVKSFRIPATCFYPAPDVDSACVCLVRRPTPLMTREQSPLFVRLVKKGFSQRRKMMLKLLKQEWPLPVLEAGFAQVGIDPHSRAEKVSLAQFVQLTQFIATTKPNE
jgi:16S rRNA (adenine1518-N6/adenine1519-N6)-dimethyltransferase